MSEFEHDFYEFDSREELAQILAEDVADSLQIAISIKGRAMLAVSGGSTPAPFFKALAQQPLDFAKLTLIMVDERWVATNHADSSERLLHEAFAGLPVKIFSLAPNDGENVDDGVRRLDSALRATNFAPDIAILGMGDDGHTASLFPNHPALKAGLSMVGDDLCVAVANSPKPPLERVTLTYNAIMRSDAIILHITGEAKRAVYEQAANAKDIHSLPISAFIKQSEKPFCVYYAK
jgi:6-phosphogluconolactonase